MQNCNSCRGGFCMAKATIYDLIIDGRKVGGAAVRKTKQGLLYQGSLCLGLPSPELLSAVLKQGDQVYQAMQQASYPLQIERALAEQYLESAIRL